ncbi:MAG: hypothetical protein ICV77_12990 [Cyanobacteria bacterium Co-bin8]|nr:hypothetical protein [Cyanobacteria bacterium Co-bin8]
MDIKLGIELLLFYICLVIYTVLAINKRDFDSDISAVGSPWNFSQWFTRANDIPAAAGIFINTLKEVSMTELNFTRKSFELLEGLAANNEKSCIVEYAKGCASLLKFGRACDSEN